MLYYRTTRRNRPAMVLLVVLVVIVLLALAAYQFSDLTMAEFQASEYAQRQAQARAIADSGVNYVAAILADPDSMTNLLSGNPYHQPEVFANVVVAADDKTGVPGKFTILAAPDPADGTRRYGVTD